MPSSVEDDVVIDEEDEDDDVSVDEDSVELPEVVEVTSEVVVVGDV